MIKIIDSLRYHDEHVMFNSAFISVLKKSFPSELLIFHAQKRHLNSVINKLESHNINISKIVFKSLRGVNNKNGTVNLLSSYLFCFFQDIFQIMSARNTNQIFFISLSPFSLLSIKLLNLYLKKQIFIVVHGELEYLNKKNKKISIKELLRVIYRSSFWKFMNYNVKYIILGHSVLNQLKTHRNKFISKNFITIDHPYLYNNHQEEIIASRNNTVNYSTIGSASVLKGTHKIFYLAKTLENSIIKNDISFSIIGKMESSMTIYKNHLVSFFDSNEFIEGKIYNKLVNNTDYIIFFYPKDFYNYIASGAFFDAIKYEKPIIALKNPYFEYYFDLLGDVGFLCNDLIEMADIIKSQNEEKRLSQKVNIRKAKKSLSIEAISKSFLSQLYENIS